MSKGKIQRNYVSPIDQFLKEFNKEHPKLSKSQQKEVEKYRGVYRLRDDENAQTPDGNKLPEGF